MGILVRMKDLWYNSGTKRRLDILEGGSAMAEEIRISRAFIEQELPQAPPLYVSVF